MATIPLLPAPCLEIEARRCFFFSLFKGFSSFACTTFLLLCTGGGQAKQKKTEEDPDSQSTKINPISISKIVSS